MPGDSPCRAWIDAADHSRSRPLQLYRTHCIDCHDTDGRGGPVREIMTSIPDFTRPDWHQASNERLVHSIREGKGSMPAMRAKLAETEVVQLVSLVRNFRAHGKWCPTNRRMRNFPRNRPNRTRRQRSQPQTPTLVVRLAGNKRTRVSRGGRGPRIYQRFCVACHGTDGQGSALRTQVPAIPDFTSPVWQQRRSDPQLTTTILEGKGTAHADIQG